MSGPMIICGPQAVGKTRHAKQIAEALGCGSIHDNWNGIDPLSPGTLALTNAEYTMPEGGLAFHIEDEAGLASLISLLQQTNSSAH